MFTSVFVALLVVSAAAWPQQPAHKNEFEPADGSPLIQSLPKELLDQIPPHVQEETKFLTAKDILVLRNVLRELPKFTSLLQVRQTLKQYSPRLESLLEKKAFKVIGVAAQKRAQLLPETKNAFHQAGQLSKTYAQSLVQLVQSQPKNVHDNLDNTFPHASYVLNSPLAKKIIEHLQHHA